MCVLSLNLVAGKRQWSSPGATGISGLHYRVTRGVRPRLEGKPRTPLSSRVTTGVSWSPLSGLRPGAQGASRVVSGKSSLHTSGEGERVLALESREGTRASSMLVSRT